LYGAIRRQRNIALAIVLTSLLYAAVHFLGERLRIPADQVTWRSGFVLLSNFFNAYRNPLELVDGFVALSLVGCLLAVIRERMGHIGTAIGMHAGFVVVILLVRKSSTADYHQPMSFLVSNRDGILGWLVALMAALTLLVVLKWLKPDSPVRKARSEYGGLESGPEGNEP
jgi:membrane protease YdiL (CAAX protease family)